jgi:hypothetical protein
VKIGPYFGKPTALSGAFGLFADHKKPFFGQNMQKIEILI